MTYDEVRRLVETRFASEWGERTGIQFPGKDFDSKNIDEFVSLGIQHGGETNKSFGAPGSNLRRNAGIVQLILRVRRDTHKGTMRLNAHTDIARPIFRHWHSGGLNFVPRTPNVESFSVSNDGIVSPWTLRTLRWPFTMDTYDG